MLIEKKSGFGSGKYNGPGGKKEANESLEDCVIREVHEETSMKIEDLTYHGFHEFSTISESKPEWEVHIYSTFTFAGTPKETNEARPVWFSLEDIPYMEMWLDDLYWLPHVLFGKSVRGKFVFSDDWKRILNYSLTIN